MDISTLKDQLVNWTDSDYASYYVAICLGIISPDIGLLDVKHVFWTDNSVGNQMYQMLIELVSIGVLEQDQQDDKFRWNPNFKSYWE